MTKTGLWAAVVAPGGEARPAAWEAFGAARELARGLGDGLSAIVLGGATGSPAVARARRLADRVVHVSVADDAALDSRQAAAAFAAALEGEEADIVVTVADAFGREWAPRLAVRLRGAPLTEVTGVAVEDGEPVFLRPVFGGKAVARLCAAARPSVVTVRAGAFSAPEEGAGEAEVRSLAAEPTAPEFEVLAREAAESAGVPLAQAAVVVSGGRGVGGPEPFRRELKELADALGGAVGASLAAVDAGWVPQSMQVGQTGTSVAPTVYIAVGISGASQHLAGIGGARHVVAINKDREAPIFRVAEVGIVGDYQTLVPEIVKAVRARFSQA
ncbi:MAG: electron transfer flavoprotein subunit alpha/FixB family protein [Clostridia bacterium]|nr:electron transfer flavoprotein subunit alpha/FixB family protein [Clostridia bacterium]